MLISLDSSLVLNNYSAMTADKLILALLDQSKFCFILTLLPSFFYKNDMK